MKSLAPSLVALGVILIAASLSAAPEARARAHRVTAIEQPGLPMIEVGTREFTVRRLLGEPVRKLGPDAWVYAGYRALPEQAPDDPCRTLLITFVAGKVADLKLVNGSAEKAIAAQLQSKPAAKALLAAK